MNRYCETAMKTPAELVFGRAKHPLRYGCALEVGNGAVVPEVKCMPRPGKEKSLESLRKEYEVITEGIMQRAVELGLPAVQIENEQVHQVSRNRQWAAEITASQRTILERFHKQHGISCALRQTVADMRNPDEGLRNVDAASRIFEAFEASAEAGADVVSIESRGGQEVFDYAMTRQDMEGMLFAIGVLGARDMDYLWKEIVKITRAHNVMAGGDTDCAHANAAMVLAGGLLHRDFPHTLAALLRAAGASRSLVAFEHGADGPAKDCGLENPVIKFITGKPISIEGKTAACAQSSLIGNITMCACDLWSNECVQYGDMFGGSTSQVFTEILGYDVALLNAALSAGFENQLRDLLALSDRCRDPQALILTPDGVCRIAKTIVGNSEDTLARTREAMLEAARIIRKESEVLQLTPEEDRALAVAEKTLSEVEDSDKFIADCVFEYGRVVSGFNPRSYDL